MKKESQKSRGLGDSIEKFTTATGIKAVVDNFLISQELIAGVVREETH